MLYPPASLVYPGAGHGAVNAGLLTSAAGNALTISLKQADGATDANAAAKARLPSHSGAGALTWKDVVASLSITIPSGTTIGHASAINCPIYVYGIDNSGTWELAVSAFFHGFNGIVSTTSISGGATSTVMYSTTGRSNVPFVLLGVIYSTQSTAGTWASNPTDRRLSPLTLKKYAFRAHRNSVNQGSWLNETFTKVVLTHEEFDPDSAFDAVTNNQFVCAEPGLYRIWASGQPNGSHAATFYGYKNGSGAFACPSHASGELGPSAGSALLQLVPGDYVELYGYQASGSTQVIYGSVGATWLAGEIVR